MGQAGSVEQKNAIRDVVNLKTSTEKTEMLEVLQRFCTYFPYEEHLVAGENAVDVKERKLFDVIHGLLQHHTVRTEKKPNEELIIVILTSFKRVILWRELYRLCTKSSMKPFTSCMLLSPKLAVVSLNVLYAIVTTCPGNETNDKVEKWEQANRRNFGDCGGFEVLRSLLLQYGSYEEEAFEKEDVLKGLLQIYHMILVAKRSTTDANTCSQAIHSLLNARIALLDLCHHRNRVLQNWAIDIVTELFVLIDLEQVHELQESAREFGALLYALSFSLQDNEEPQFGAEVKQNASIESIQEKNINLVELFCAGNTRSKKAMCRIFPVELFIPSELRAELMSRHTASTCLKNTRNTKSLPHFSFDFDMNNNVSNTRNRVVSLAVGSKNTTQQMGEFKRWLQDARSQGENWRNIIQSVLETHERPELVWRDEMRRELREALCKEIDILENKKKRADIVPWDHEMFCVTYSSIDQELVVHGYFIHHLIPKLADLTDSYEIPEPVVLVWYLSDRLAVEEREEWKIKCVRCMRLLMRRYAMMMHGQLPTCHIVKMLENHQKHSIAFIRECFLLLSTSISTTKATSSENLSQLYCSLTRQIVNVVSDPIFFQSLCEVSSTKESTKTKQSTQVYVEAEVHCDEEIQVQNIADGVIRAGVNVLLAIIRRAKYVLLQIRPKRPFFCRLLSVEGLGHVTTSRILSVLNDIAVLDASNFPVDPDDVNAKSVLGATNHSNWKSLALVYVLMTSTDPQGAGMCEAAAEFLKEHFVAGPVFIISSAASENPATRKPKESELNQILQDALGFGGCGIGPLLACSTAPIFASIFNAEEKKAADVLWGKSQREKLHEYLKNKYVYGEGDEEESNVYGVVQNTASGVVSDSLSASFSFATSFTEDIFIGNVFLRSYVESDGDFLTDWSFEMHENLIQALFQHLIDLSKTKSVFGVNHDTIATKRHGRSASLSEKSLEPWEIQVLILKALIKLLPGRCIHVEVKHEHYASLLIPFRRTLLGDSDQLRCILAIELFISLLCLPTEKSTNAKTCRSFLEEHGLSTLSEALERMLNPSYRQLLRTAGTTEHARKLLYRLSDLLLTLATSPSGIRSIQKTPRIISYLLEHASKMSIMSYSPEAASVSLHCLKTLASYPELSKVLMDAGGLLYLLEVTSSCPREEVSPSDGEPSQYFAAVRGAALVLKTCLQPTEEEENMAVCNVLKQLLTPSFVRILRKSPDRFLSNLQSEEDINSSTLFWTWKMRKELEATLQNELVKIKTAAAADCWPRWNPDHFIAADSFRYQYPDLADQLIVYDVYIDKFVEEKDIRLDDISIAGFSEALLISIQSNENVLRILQERGTSDPSKVKALGKLRIAMNKLVGNHPQHNLEVNPAPPSSSIPSPIQDENGDQSRSKEVHDDYQQEEEEGEPLGDESDQDNPEHMQAFIEAQRRRHSFQYEVESSISSPSAAKTEEVISNTFINVDVTKPIRPEEPRHNLSCRPPLFHEDSADIDDLTV